MYLTIFTINTNIWSYLLWSPVIVMGRSRVMGVLKDLMQIYIYIYIYIHPLLREFKSEAAEFQGTRENVYATEMMASTYRGGRREGTCDNGLCGKGGPVDNDYYCDQGCALVDYQVAGRSFSWHCLR